MRYTYETIDDSSYIVATFPGGENIDNNQLQILANNDLENIIKPRYRFVGEDVLVSYNITSKISLDQATVKRKIHKNGFINIIEGALSALEDVEKCGLLSSGIVFDEKNVYVKAGTYEPSFIYLPCATQDTGIETVKNFILFLIMTGKIERMNDGFFQMLFDALNNPNLCANDLRELCNEQTKGRKNAAKLSQNARFSVITPTMIDSESEILNSVYKIIETENDKSKVIFQDNYSKNYDAKPTEKRKPKKYIFLLLQLIIAGIIIAVSVSGFFDNADGTLNIKYLLGIIFALCIANLVVYRELFMSDKSVNGDEDINTPASSVLENTPQIEEQKAVECPPPLPIQRAPMSLEQIYAGAKGSEADDTVLLGDENSCSYLEFFENGIFKKIKLDKDVVIVGKLSSQCDYAINNNKISKMHAEFIVRGDKYFVKDCNSTNGTYINGNTQRIASNVEYQIYDGDQITLANVEMILRCS